MSGVGDAPARAREPQGNVARHPVQLVVSLPLPREASPNEHGKMADRWRAIRTARMIARSETAAQLPIGQQPWTAATLDIEWYAARGPLPDDDNVVATCKPSIDGVADALMGGDDAGIRIGTVTTYRGPDLLVLRLTRTEEEETR